VDKGAAKVKIELARKADIDMTEIWIDNAERYSVDHADKYSHFLVESLQELAKNLALSGPVDEFPSLRSFTMKRRARGHGHIAFFEIHDDTIMVVRVLHTAMDFVSHLGDGW